MNHILNMSFFAVINQHFRLNFIQQNPCKSPCFFPKSQLSDGSHHSPRIDLGSTTSDLQAEKAKAEGNSTGGAPRVFLVQFPLENHRKMVV